MSLPIEKSSSDELAREVARRRTFAIISHPDAGKTTLTEKLLLYAGAVHLAGAVHARSWKNVRERPGALLARRTRTMKLCSSDARS